MMERGYDNIFMLSGGLRVAYIKFPERLVTKGAIENMEGDEKARLDYVLYFILLNTRFKCCKDTYHFIFIFFFQFNL